MSPKGRKPVGLIIYLFLLILVAISYFFFLDWWYNNLRIILNYFREMSILFSFLCFITIIFHLHSLKEKEIVLEKKGFYFLGPFIYLLSKPSITSSTFYVALFMLYTIVNEPFYEELPAQELILLLAFIAGLLYWSISECYNMVYDIRYLKTSVKIKRKR